MITDSTSIIYVIVSWRTKSFYRIFQVVADMRDHTARKLDHRLCPTHSFRVYCPLPLSSHSGLVPDHIVIDWIYIALAEIWYRLSGRRTIKEPVMFNIVVYFFSQCQVNVVERYKVSEVRIGKSVLHSLEEMYCVDRRR